jgi:hypothetical protein
MIRAHLRISKPTWFLWFLKKPISSKIDRFLIRTVTDYCSKNGFRLVSSIYQPIFVDFKNWYCSSFWILAPTSSIIRWLVRLVPSGVVAPALGALAPAPRALPPAPGDVEERVGARVFVRWARVVAPALEPGRALPLRWYRPPLGLVGGSEVSPLDWSV